MLPIFLILASSIAAGFLLRKARRLLSSAQKLTTVAIWGLLFVLGASVGAETRILANLHTLAYEAGVICLAALAGSLAVAHAVDRLFLRKGRA